MALTVLAEPDVPALAGLTVSYIAEYQETLQTLYAFLRVEGVIPGHKVEAKVIASGSSNGIERLLLKCGPNWSRPLRLPVHVKTGSQEVRHQGDHYEINLPVNTTERPAPLEAKALLDVEQILALGPTSFVCNSCSLPLVQASKITRWNDLPSEHWAELLDAWMCHNDQKLADQARKAAHGFWPVEGQALVGGSYILFDETAVVPTNVTSSPAPSLVSTITLCFLFRPSFRIVGSDNQEGHCWHFLPVVGAVLSVCSCHRWSLQKPARVSAEGSGKLHADFALAGRNAYGRYKMSKSQKPGFPGACEQLSCAEGRATRATRAANIRSSLPLSMSEVCTMLMFHSSLRTEPHRRRLEDCTLLVWRGHWSMPTIEERRTTVTIR